MARMNISIPDSLYERVDRLRDRVNASKVCATALEKELDMIEGRTAVADPEIAQLIQRLQSTRERWYKRGRDDGKRWAVSTATRQELWRAKDHLEGEDGAELAEDLTRGRGGLRRVFGGYDFEAAINRWVREDQSAGAGGAHEFRLEDDEDDEHDDQPRVQPDRAAVDLAGYMEGWRDVLDEIWQVVSAALR